MNKVELTGVEHIARERYRQCHKHGYTPLHDDQHNKGEILTAAILIAMDVDSKDVNCIHPCGDDEDDDWMHELALHVRNKYGPDYRHRLTIAGAMIAAEIDRLQRKETP